MGQPGSAAPPSPSNAQGNPAAPRIELSEAVAIVRKLYPNVPPIEVELESIDGRDALEVEVLTDSGIHEVYLDPHSGNVIKEAEEELSEAEAATLPELRKQLAAAPSLTLEKAIAIAESKYPIDTIREVELEIHDGSTLVMEVGVAKNDKVHACVHDPKTGDSLGEEDESEEHGEAAK